ncbi:glycylpeptide N-tetradecanoyltransferase [Cryptococcus deuterogattii 99/473]|uniref:Glycylpeptide N-tetradecanoyltransferase n=1 Tax=Cryptococcus deuterogattii Ram5 TaxID=1296110 RepID=A0A0D0TSN6_9TREE|nr:glycylpeptide N-tetradecanoyltransferase [Cryptococcus deuterogattii Ram5]KIY54131.1 glycylpeptide N-tetradecanoyltransferase [Cryptococcus deuterogattii 99/473]
MSTLPNQSLPTEPQPGVEEVLDKFQKLGEEAAEEDANEDDADAAEDGDDGEDDDEQAEDGGGGEGSGDKKKKKKKKKKGKASKAVEKLKTIATGQAPQEVVDAVRGQMDSSDSMAATDEEIRRALKAADLMRILDGKMALGNKSGTKNLGEHKFWKTQPVPQITGSGAPAPIEEGPIDDPKTPADVRQEPGVLPAGFEWSTIDIHDEEQSKEVYVLLCENYVEDDDAMFRFNYSREFLLWALTAPGYLPDWHIGVRVQKTKKLVAFISGIKIDVRVRAKTFPVAEINFLCVHKKLRSKRLAPVLIKEVTRRVNLTNIWQAIYTAGVILPTPIGTCRYFHRNLNPPKLVDIGFSPLPRGSTIARLVQQYTVPSHPRIPGFREMKKEDVPQVGALLRRYLDRFDVAQAFKDDDEVEHWFLSGQGKEVGGRRIEQVVWAYVVEDPTTHRITDLISFYALPSTIMKHPKHNLLNAAYMFYYATDVVFSPSSSSAHSDADVNAGESSVAAVGTGGEDAKTKKKLETRLNALTADLLVIAKQFGPGDGYLNYYLYNWNCASIDGGQHSTTAKQGSKIGVVML